MQQSATPCSSTSSPAGASNTVSAPVSSEKRSSRQTSSACRILCPTGEANSLQMAFGSTAAACAGVMCSAFFSRSISPRTCSGVDTHE